MFTVEYYALEALLLIYIERIFLSPFPQNKYHYVFTLRKKKKPKIYTIFANRVAEVSDGS